MGRNKVVPMIHVPDVRATVTWYESIGFTVNATYGDEGEGLSFAILSFGTSEVMFNSGGHPSTRHRRDVDLYVYTESVDDLYENLKDRVEVVEGPHDTFYGMREIIIRDLNRFWVTFGQDSVFGLLMTGICEGNAELVRTAIAGGSLKQETLTAALVAASASGNKNDEIVDLLKNAGAVTPPEVEAETLQSYVGNYTAEPGIEFHVTLRDGKLCGAPGSQEPLGLMAIDQTTFRPIAFDNFGTVTFIVEDGKTVGCEVKHDQGTMQLKRAEETTSTE